VRRVWGTVLLGLLGLAVGFAIGFPHGLLKRSVGATWFEVVGAWVGFGVIAIAVIPASIAFFSEEFARRRERRQAEAAEEARQVERAQLQQQADLVACDVRCSDGFGIGEPGRTRVTFIEVEATNQSSCIVRDLTCHVPQLGDEPIWLWDALQGGEPHKQKIQVPQPFTTYEDHRELRGSAEFSFSLDGARWSAKYGQRAKRLDSARV
jgi:hypothetical protein